MVDIFDTDKSNIFLNGRYLHWLKTCKYTILLELFGFKGPTGC